MWVPSELVIIIDYIIVDNEILAYDQETTVRSANLAQNRESGILSWGGVPHIPVDHGFDQPPQYRVGPPPQNLFMDHN